MRGFLHVFDLECRPRARDAIFLMERLTPVHAHLAPRFPRLVGSEYLGEGLAPGTVRNGIRHEDATGLSFADASLAWVLSQDVFEHVPDYRAALRECARVLKPGGALLWTVPIDAGRVDSLLRASIGADGRIVHHEPAEYHGDPMSLQGVLAFHTFGWSLLEDVRGAGFADAFAAVFRSDAYGYLGPDSIVFIARR